MVHFSLVMIPSYPAMQSTVNFYYTYIEKKVVSKPWGSDFVNIAAKFESKPKIYLTGKKYTLMYLQMLKTNKPT